MGREDFLFLHMLSKEERETKAYLLNLNRKAIFHTNRYMMDFHPEIETEVITAIDIKHDCNEKVSMSILNKYDSERDDFLEREKSGGIVYYVSHYPKREVYVGDEPRTTIRDVYSFIKIQNNLFRGLYGIVATYDYEKAVSGYAFSHLPSVSLSNGRLPIINACCLGTSNLRDIQSDHMMFPDSVEDDMFYIVAMNCYELFGVESMTSSPYIRISNISNDGNMSMVLIDYDPNMEFETTDKVLFHAINRTINEMILSNKRYIRLGATSEFEMNRLKLSTVNNVYPYFNNFTIDASRLMVKYIQEGAILFGEGRAYADSLINFNMYDAYIIKKDGVKYIYSVMNSQNMYVDKKFEEINGSFLFKFKGRDVKLNILEKKKGSKDCGKTKIIVKNLLNPMYTLYLKSMLNFKTSQNE